MNFDLNYYTSIFWRRFPYFIAVVSLFTCLGFVTAMVLPPEYEANARLLVESPQIPDELASSTVRTNPQEQLQIIEQRLMTRANLLEIARELDVFESSSETGSPASATEIVDSMRARTRFQRQSGRDAATLLGISFRASSATAAAAVANELVTRVLQSNVEMRTNQAASTLDFFRQEVNRLSAELNTKSDEILAFKSAHAQALPQDESYLRDRQSSVSSTLGQIDREMGILNDQKVRLIEIFEQTGRLSVDESQLSPEERALNAARSQLDEALLVYSANHPRVKMLEARIGQLEQQFESSGASSSDGKRTLLDAQVAEIDTRLDALRDLKETNEAELTRINGLLAELPKNGIELEALERDYENIQLRYNSASARLSQAETGERIEATSQGQRITVIEQATVPTTPTKPNRAAIAAAGVGAGIAAGLGLILLLELLNKAIRRPIELTDKLGITPIAVLPYVPTSAETSRKRWSSLVIAAVLLLLLPVALFMIHSYVFPLDELIEKALNKFGFSLLGS
ncbi:GumC family protein [Qingshengfaniella alkalisoli]|nr:Wzz/FepE/Etk N-terminal domain-containing protein [Qingshengfaniella alkalisoli]